MRTIKGLIVSAFDASSINATEQNLESGTKNFNDVIMTTPSSTFPSQDDVIFKAIEQNLK